MSVDPKVQERTQELIRQGMTPGNAYRKAMDEQSSMTGGDFFQWWNNNIAGPAQSNWATYGTSPEEKQAASINAMPQLGEAAGVGWGKAPFESSPVPDNTPPSSGLINTN